MKSNPVKSLCRTCHGSSYADEAANIDCEICGGTGYVWIAAPNVAEPPKARHPQVISGEIRSYVERITTRSDRISNKEDALVADVHDSMRISELLTELDASMKPILEQAQKVVLEAQLEASLKART